MSDVTLAMRQQIVRSDRMTEESQTFRDEQRTLAAEAAKLAPDRAFLPRTVVATLLGAGAALFAAGAAFVKLLGTVS